MQNVRVPVMVGSESDKQHMDAGLQMLRSHGVEPDLYYSSVHRALEATVEAMRQVRGKYGDDPKVIIAGSHNATGLAGCVAGYFQDTNAMVIGVRFTNDILGAYLNDGAYQLSEVPSRCCLVYAGTNSPGFVNACTATLKVLGVWQKIS